VIDGADVLERADTLFRLASIPNAKIEAILNARGLDPSNIDATVEVVAAVGIPIDAEEAINYSFRPRVDPPDYPIGRFGDGTYAVFYSALEDATCVEEVRHHRRAELLALQSGQIPFARFFTLVKCDFNGRSLMLRGHERAHADLTSPTAAGYPFCQAVARWARRIGAQALHTASARQANGTCVPVFVRACLANPQTVHRYRFYSRNGVVECEGLPPHA
jgi:hypothetical protein